MDAAIILAAIAVVGIIIAIIVSRIRSDKPKKPPTQDRPMTDDELRISYYREKSKSIIIKILIAVAVLIVSCVLGELILGSAAIGILGLLICISTEIC